MPVADWQFWVVTLLGLLGVYAMVRAVFPRRRRGRRVPLTVGGRSHRCS